MNMKIILAYQSNCASEYIGEFPLNMYRNPKKVKTLILTAANNFTFTEVNLFKEIRKERPINKKKKIISSLIDEVEPGRSKKTSLGQ